MRAGTAVATALATAVGMLLACTGAWASHNSIELLSTGPTGGNGALSGTFRGSSADGTRVFFQTNESLVSGDTDTRTDVY